MQRKKITGKVFVKLYEVHFLCQNNKQQKYFSSLFIVRRGRQDEREASTNTLIIKGQNIAVKFSTHTKSKKANLTRTFTTQNIGLHARINLKCFKVLYIKK